MTPQLRIARPVADLAKTCKMYTDGLGLEVLGSFENHEGFDGVMLGLPGAGYHFEFTCYRAYPVKPPPRPRTSSSSACRMPRNGRLQDRPRAGQLVTAHPHLIHNFVVFHRRNQLLKSKRRPFPVQKGHNAA